MYLIVCAKGDANELKYFSRLEELGVGIELQNYGFQGITSSEAWDKCIEMHKGIVANVTGPIALHGPFKGMDFFHQDHIFKRALRERMDRVFELVKTLNPNTIVLHTGVSDLLSKFKLQQHWLDDVSAFWKNEIKMYEDIGVKVALENVVESDPYLSMQLINEVDSPSLGFCLDVGHVNLCSNLTLAQWVEKLSYKLFHVHLHDNCGDEDKHLPVGKGNINFNDLFSALRKSAPDVVVSLEVDADPPVVLENLKEVKRLYFSDL